MADILLENAVKTYNGGKVTAVNRLTISCKNREFVSILGPSGAGKTSTLKMIAGIERIDEGRLLIDGKDMTDAPSQARNVSMVFEGYALYPHMTVRENLAFPLEAPARGVKLSKQELNEKVEEWARIVGMEELLERKPSQLSGGQRQRVSLARALVRAAEPNVILMDEPIAHLDAKLRNNMRAELKRLHKDLGATILYVTHDYTEAMAMSDRIVVINNGHLMQEGTPKEIYENPFNEFVASTVGEPPMNFFEGEAMVEDGECVFTYRGERISLPQDVAMKGKVDLGIRPAELCVYREMPTGRSFRGTVRQILPMGAKQIMEVDVAGKMVLAKANRDFTYTCGDMVFLKPFAGKIYLFDCETKARVGVVKGE